MHADPLRILCISPLFPPAANPEAFCGGKMVLALRQAGVDVVVLRDRSSLTPLIDSSSCWRVLTDLTAEIDGAATWNKPWAVLLAGRYLSVRHGRLIRGYLQRALRRHRDKPFHLVYSRSLPMYAHIIGYWCARALGLPWVASVNDPWDLHLFPEVAVNPPSWLRGVAAEYWLRKGLAAATLVTYPSARLRDFHVRLSGVPHASAIIPHVGWTAGTGAFSAPATGTGTFSPGGKGASPFHLVHAGRLVDTVSQRGCSCLLRGFQQFLACHPEARADVRLTLVGPDDAASRDLAVGLHLQDRIRWTGQVGYEESLQYIQDASVCLLVEGSLKEGIYLPSKFADYAAAGKSILALSPAPGVIADMLPCRGLVRVDPQDVPAIGKAIGQFYQLYKDGRLHRECPPEEFISQFAPARVADTFLRAVQDVVPALSCVRNSPADQGGTLESAAEGQTPK